MSTKVRTRRAVVGLASALLLMMVSACAKEDAESRPEPRGNTPPAVAHGSHDPAHGGIMSMTADLHFETVLHSAGRHQVHFSDGARRPLPASTLAAVSMTLERHGAQQERLELDPDARGAFWVAEGRPLGKVPVTKVVVTFNRPGESPTSFPIAVPDHGHDEH
ncbi:MAG: hypothetical protein KJ015_35980 [Myxococcales bacterium]|nr:hypothetical protein [Myxococcales bacterium]